MTTNQKLEAINAELLEALSGLMPFAQVVSPKWASDEAKKRNHEMYESAFSKAETAIANAQPQWENE